MQHKVVMAATLDWKIGTQREGAPEFWEVGHTEKK